jgi:hypothetical protein
VSVGKTLLGLALGAGVVYLVRKLTGGRGELDSSGRYYTDRRYSLPVTSNPVDGRNAEKPARTGRGPMQLEPNDVFRLEQGTGGGYNDPAGVYGIDWGVAWIPRAKFTAVRLAAIRRGDATFTMWAVPPGESRRQGYVFATVSGKVMRRL